MYTQPLCSIHRLHILQLDIPKFTLQLFIANIVVKKENCIFLNKTKNKQKTHTPTPLPQPSLQIQNIQKQNKNKTKNTQKNPKIIYKSKTKFIHFVSKLIL